MVNEFAICLIISIFVSLIWAGEDLHKSIIKKIQGLADSIEGEMDYLVKIMP